MTFEFAPSSSLLRLQIYQVYPLKLNLWPPGVGGWRRLCPFKVSEADYWDMVRTITREHRPVAGLCFWRNRPLTLFYSPFLLFGNRGLRPNLINFQGFFVRHRNFCGDGFIQSCYFWNRPGFCWSEHSLDFSGVASCWWQAAHSFALVFLSFAWIGIDWPGWDAHHGILLIDSSFPI